MAERVRRAVIALGIPRDESRAGGLVTVSVGCASLLPEEGQSPAVLVDAAEKALFAAKEGGRNRVSD